MDYSVKIHSIYFHISYFSIKENDVQKQIHECGNIKHICTTNNKAS